MPVPKTKTPKRWTVLAWIAGDNNLDSYGLSDIKEMKRIGSTKDVDVVVQFDRRGNGKTYRYHLKKGTPLASDVVDTLGETDTGDPAVATDFFTWGMRTYPSEKVLAVIWNHGSGIDEADVYARARNSGIRIERRARARPNIRPRSQARAIVTSGFGRSLFGTTLDSAIRLRAIAYDDYNRDFLDNAELKRVLVNVVKQAKRPIDVLGFDACLMNMVEVAYQLLGRMRGSSAISPRSRAQTARPWLARSSSGIWLRIRLPKKSRIRPSTSVACRCWPRRWTIWRRPASPPCRHRPKPTHSAVRCVPRSGST